MRYFLRPTAIFYQVNSVIMWHFPGSMILRVTPSFHRDNAVKSSGAVLCWHSFEWFLATYFDYKILLLLLTNEQLLNKVEQNTMICLWQADQLFAEAERKSRYFAITEFNNNIVLSFNLTLSLFFIEYPWEAKRSAIFHATAIPRRRKARFPLRKSRIWFAAKHCWTAFAHEQTIICRQLFAGY